MHEPFKTGLGALYGPLILNMKPALMNLRAMNAFKGTINVNFLSSGPWLELNPSVIEGLNGHRRIYM